MNTIIFIIFMVLVPVRWLRWLAIIQQKEYRPDRILAYLKSAGGRGELWRLIPRPGDYTRGGLKRPRLTPRILFVLGVSSLPVVLCGWLIFSQNTFSSLAIGALGYFLLPVLVILATAPSHWISERRTIAVLRRAQSLIGKSNPKVIGITGSYGKTSTKLLLAHVLGKRYTVFTTPKSFNQRYSIAQSVLSGYSGQKYVVLEYAAYKEGEIKELTRYIKPQIAVITGLTNQHLSTFGDTDRIIKAKSELVGALSDKSEVFYNGRDPGAVRIVRAGGAQKAVDYTAVRSLGVSLARDVRLNVAWGDHKIKTNLVGIHYLGAVAAVITLCKHLGLTDREICKGIEDFEPGENFVRTRVLQNGALLIDDGRTANPAGFKAGIDLLRSLKTTPGKAKAILLFAGIIDLGSESHKTHTELAAYAEEVVDHVLFVGLDGLEEFHSVFSKRLVSDERGVRQSLRELRGDVVVLLEGYIPKNYEAYLQ